MLALAVAYVSVPKLWMAALAAESDRRRLLPSLNGLVTAIVTSSRIGGRSQQSLHTTLPNLDRLT
jgi:hypothetical protein